MTPAPKGHTGSGFAQQGMRLFGARLRPGDGAGLLSVSRITYSVPLGGTAKAGHPYGKPRGFLRADNKNQPQTRQQRLNISRVILTAIPNQPIISKWMSLNKSENSLKKSVGNRPANTDTIRLFSISFQWSNMPKDWPIN